jgi:soluble lytic murein transglycosylase
LKKFFSNKILIFCCFILLVLLLNNNFDFWTLRRNFEPIKYQNLIKKYAEQNQLDYNLLAALIYVESRFDNESISAKGAVGLMQLMPETANWVAENLAQETFNLSDLKDPEQNIKFGSWYFSYLLQKFDFNLVKTLAAYNAGERNVNKWIVSGWDGKLTNELPFAETDDFVRRVLATRDYYHNFKLNSINSNLFSESPANSFWTQKISNE